MIRGEYVCSGNWGRSPMLETLAREEVRQRGLSDRIVITSSGAGIHPLNDSNKLNPNIIDYSRPETAAACLRYINIGISNSLFKGDLIALSEKVASEGTEAKAEDIERCIKLMLRAEETFRNHALLEIGLVAQGPFYRPTQAEPDIDMIFPVTKGVEEFVRKIYDASGVPLPKIMTLHGLPDAFGNQLPAYRERRDFALAEIIPQTVEALIAHGNSYRG